MEELLELQKDGSEEDAMDLEIHEQGMILCVRCGQDKYPHKDNKHLCVDCVRVENQMVSHRRAHNEGWMAVAKEAEIELWERQPRETDREWGIWLCYRDQYPSKKPTYSDVAEQVKTTVANVRSVGSRWDYSVRMQAWAKYVDIITQEQRQKEILGMNAKHISMAKKLNEKLEKVIDALDIETVTPAQLSSLMKIATELERKANIDSVGTVAVLDNLRDQKLGSGGGVDAPKAKKEDLQQIVDILAKAGALEHITGMKKTVTTTTVEHVELDVCTEGAHEDDYIDVTQYEEVTD